VHGRSGQSGTSRAPRPMEKVQVFDPDCEGLGVVSSSASGGGDKEEPNAIYTCKFPGCERQYASTDGVRKHCRKSHPDWLHEQDLEKAALGCRWAAYCTRQTIEDGTEDPRTTLMGSKRAREIMSAGNAAHSGTFNTTHLASKPNVPSISSEAALPASIQEETKEAFGDRGTLVPPRPSHRASEKVVPPEMVAMPGAEGTRPPESKLTPNAQARQRVRALGEIADQEGISSVTPGNADFFAWGMPPLKRGLSLADTRESTIGGIAMVPEPRDDETHPPPLSVGRQASREAFLDSIIA